MHSSGEYPLQLLKETPHALQHWHHFYIHAHDGLWCFSAGPTVCVALHCVDSRMHVCVYI